MKCFLFVLFIALSVQAFLPKGLATKTTTDIGRLTTSSGALGALAMVSSSVNLVDAVPGRRRRRRSQRCALTHKGVCIF